MASFFMLPPPHAIVGEATHTVGLQPTSELIFAAIHAKSFDSESDIQVQVL